MGRKREKFRLRFQVNKFTMSYAAEDLSDRWSPVTHKLVMSISGLHPYVIRLAALGNRDYAG